MNNKLNKVAIITGASRGIGAATALRLASEGYNICVNYRQNVIAANKIVEQIKSYDVLAIAVQADISLEDDVQKLFKTVNEQWGRLDVLVNNAGVLFKQNRVDSLTSNRIEKIFKTNVIGAFLCCKEAVLQMSTKYGGSGGVVVNISSVAAKTGSPNEYVDYAASKAAIDALTIGLSQEVAEEGIRVNTVRPGFIYTNMHADGGEADRVDRVKKFVPLKRGGYPDEVAAAISWLVSNESSYTTGAFIDVAGGR